MKKIAILSLAMLALSGGSAMAQRCLPGMSAVEVKADMVDGFYTGNSRDCGYAFGVNYSIFMGNANTWSFGGEYLQTYKPYGEKGRIPVAQFTGEVGYNLHLVSDYSQTFHLYAGASAFGGYETVNWGKTVLSDGSMTATLSSMVARLRSRLISTSRTRLPSAPMSRNASYSATIPATSGSATESV